MKLGIAKKLFIFFLFFILIFYGTVFDLFMKAQDMSKTSARIVSINNHISSLSENLLDSLMDMDVNNKKFSLLKKTLYFDSFEIARKAYRKDLGQIVDLDSQEYPLSDIWKEMDDTFLQYTEFYPLEVFMDMPGQWATEEVITQWMTAISQARKTNENQIEQALIQVNNQSRLILRNGMIGFGISILIGLLGVLFISRSILSPLNKLKIGLKNISNDNYTQHVSIHSNDEFSDLAAVFNDMSRQLKEDEDIRSDFIATLSHEIRTPLSSIQESVNMMIEKLLGPVNEKQIKFLKIATSEITRITSLLNHLMDTSMLASQEDSQSKQFCPKPLDPNRLIQEAALGLASTAEANLVEIHTRELEDQPMVLGEKKEIMQVLLNIIGNAVKFSPQNSRVDIWLEKPIGDSMLHFQVVDQGPGIPLEEQSLIFKKYYRAKEVRNHMNGVGLGLNISKRIVLAHGGTISVENNEDKGAQFSFALPVHRNTL